MSEQLELLMHHAFEVARKTIEDGDENLPTWVFQNDQDNGIDLVVSPWGSSSEKMIVIEMMRQHIKENGFIRMVLVVEDWCVEAASNENIECTPSEHPDRKEVLLMNGEEADGTQVFRQYPILRPQNKLGEEIVKGQGHIVSGNLVQMFDRPTQTKH